MLGALLLLPPLLASSFSAPVGPTTGKKLVFDQDFSKLKKIDTKIWHFDDGPVYNNEQEKYVSGPGEFAKIEGGNLVITAKRVNGQITSARIDTRQSWLYGYFEAEAKVPVGKGTWPAFWMLNQHIRDAAPNNIPWPRCGEIDVMENVGWDPTKYHFSLHSQDLNFTQKTQRTFILDVPGETTYHKFGCHWQPDRIDFYLDRKLVSTFTKDKDTFENWPYSQPFYIILNLAIGGWGAEKGLDESIFPAEYKIKYVKVWQ